MTQLRARADYGGGRHVSQAEATEAVKIAFDILTAVEGENPGVFDKNDIP